MEKNMLDVYKSKGFMDIQLRQIQLGLEDKLPVEVYAKTEYDWFQMEEIRMGLKANVDVSLYANPHISYEKMRQIRKGLLAGMDLTEYLDKSAGIIRQIRHARMVGIDIVKYIEEGYDAEQLSEIAKALSEGIALDEYINNEFRAASIAEIRCGIEQGLDVSLYAKIYYSWRQMREIRLGLERRIDVSKYNSKLYNWEQMREIRLGLEDGLDVESYRLLRYTAREMKIKRQSIMENEYSEGLASMRNIKAASEDILAVHKFPSDAVSAPKIVQNKGAKPILGKHNLKLEFRANNMEAYLIIEMQNGIFEMDLLMEYLEEKDVRAGIISTALEKIANGKYDKKPILVAQGKIPIKGADGWYEYFFKTDMQKKPKMLEDGSVDYHDIEWFEVVKEGQKLAYYHEALEGTDGYDVSGNVIKARKGIEKRILRGKGFCLEEDKKTYRSLLNGMIRLEDDEMSITNHLMLDEINMTTGDINFDGSIHILGDVSSGMRVKATGDIVIDGNVEAAVIESDANIMLRKGMNASGNGMVVAGKNVVSRFFEATRVVADGNIEVDKCLNSQLYAKGMITSTRVIAGGILRTESGFYLNHVGNHAGLRTVLKVQLEDKVRYEYHSIEDGITEVTREVQMLTKTYDEFLEKFTAEQRSAMEVFQKVEKAVYTKKKQLSQLVILEAELKKKIDKVMNARVVIGGNAYEGVVVEISGCRWEAQNQYNVTIRQQNSQMEIYNN